MLVIRMSRGGRKKYPVYRIVAADKRRAATGKFVAVLGHYNPHTKTLVIKKDELKKYIDNGAQPSNAVLKLMKAEKITLPKWAEIKTYSRQPKKAAQKDQDKVVEIAAETAQAKAEVAGDQPAQETPAEVSKAQADAKQADKVADAVIETAKEETETEKK